ncbi:hypothetical protein G9A89_021030 [Geosiphon pyriformis]|nr:hypothetical protein G9A89_021030 [Geosiphon pyriformis]
MRKHVDTVYFCGVFYKKLKILVIGNVVDLSAGSLSLENIGVVGVKPVVFWGNNVGSIANSISGLFNVKNMKNTTTSPKVPLYNNMSNNDKVLELLSPKFNGSNQFFNSAKSFALNIELFTVSGKTVSDKLISVKKIFYHVNGFGRALTLSKFPGIIRSFFTSELSLEKAKKLAISEKILKIVVKEIPVDLFKLAVESVFSKFGKIVLIKIKNLVHVTLAVSDKELWITKNYHQAFLYTLSVEITAYDLSDLLNSYSRKTCFIGHNPSLYVCNRCVIVCFTNKISKLAAVGSVSVFKDVNLHWAGLFLACYALCKQFGHVFNVCSVVLSGGGSPPDVASFFLGFAFSVNSGLSNHVAVLEQFLELLSDQVSVLLKKLSFVELVFLTVFSSTLPLVVSVFLVLNMVLDNMLVLSTLSFFVSSDLVADFSSSNSKILTTKIGRLNLVWKIAICNAQNMNNPTKQEDIIYWHKNIGNLILIITETKLKDSGYLGSGIAIIMDSFLACYVCKVSEVPVNTIVSCDVLDVNEHFDTNYQVVYVSVGLGGLLNMQLNSLHNQVNKDHWKFNFKYADKAKFHKLEILVLRIVKSLHGSVDSMFKFLMSCLTSLDFDKALSIQTLLNSGMDLDYVCSALFNVHKSYYASKFAKSIQAKELRIKSAVNKYMENFAVNKSHTIRSILEHPFQKVVLDHLVVEDKLILKPNLVKTKIDKIMKDWTKKHECGV